MNKTIAALTISVALAACSGNSSPTLGFPAADADDDDTVSPEEFLEFWSTTNRYADYDLDGDGSLNRNEYSEAVDDAYDGDEFFHGLDRNLNSLLSRQEFIAGWYGMFDVDRNGVLSRAEYDAAIDALDD